MTVNNLGNLAQMTGLSQAELAKRAEQLVDAKTGKISALAALEAALVDAAAAGKTNAEAFTAAGSASINPHTIDDPLHEFTHGVPMDGFAPEPPAPPSIGGPAALLERAAKLGASRISGFCGGCYAPPPACEPEAPPPPPPPPPTSPESNAGAGSNDAVVLSSPPPPTSPEASTAPAPAPATPAPAAPAPAPAAPPQTAAPTAPTRDFSPALVRQTQPAPTTAPKNRVPVTLSGSSSSANATQKRGFVQPSSSSSSGAAAGAAGPTGSFDQNTRSTQSDLDASSRNIQFELLKQQVQKMSEMQTLMSNVLSAMHEQGMTAIRNVKA